MLYLEDAPKCFEEARTLFYGNGHEAEFYHQLAHMLPDVVDVDTLILAIRIALNDEDREERDTVGFIAIIPKYIEQIASKEFSLEFREKYIKEVLGIDKPELPEEDYGIVEIEDDIIDLSDKDKYEVLAFLYNAAIPVGAGFMQYNPSTWDKDTAEYYWNNFAESDEEGNVYFRYVLGRLLHVRFNEIDNYVDVHAYNKENIEGFAQKVISKVPNKSRSLK